MKYTCPCCGYQTLDEESPGTFDVCSICYWEDDLIQFEDPTYNGGANKPSLKQAQQNFLKFGACDEYCKAFTRNPLQTDRRDPNWKPL